MKHLIILVILLSIASAKTSGQCFLDRHNTTWFDGWISCETSMNPNATRGESHWIMYDLNEPYSLFQMHIWNTNAPEYLTNGMQEIAIDISNDGSSWTSVGEFTLPMADGTSTYEGMDLYDFGGTNARFVLITGLSNHGGDCYGLSEIRIDVTDEIVTSLKEPPVDVGCLTARITPNPVNATSQAFISSTCGTAPIFYAIQDLSGKTLKRGQINLVSEEAVLDLDEVPLVSGMYLLTLRQDQVMKRVKMVKAK